MLFFFLLLHNMVLVYVCMYCTHCEILKSCCLYTDYLLQVLQFKAKPKCGVSSAAVPETSTITCLQKKKCFSEPPVPQIKLLSLMAVYKHTSTVAIPKTSSSHLCQSAEQVLLSGPCQQNKRPHCTEVTGDKCLSEGAAEKSSPAGCICLSKGRATRCC